jgi:hypothetical protein
VPADASSSNGKGMDEDTIWSQLAFPSYLQSRETHKKGVCREFDKAITAAERKQGADASMEEDLEEEDPAEAVWLSIRYSQGHIVVLQAGMVCLENCGTLMHRCKQLCDSCASVGTSMCMRACVCTQAAVAS